MVSATLDALVAENRELRRDLNRERARLRAIGASRWWRLHPRRLVGGTELDRAEPNRGLPSSEPSSPRSLERVGLVEDPALARFATEIMARGSFSQDWVTPRFSRWRPILDDLDGRPSRILEIGSFEGLSACYLLWRLPQATLTCVETFEGVHEQAGTAVIGLEEAFDSNIALVDPSRLRKLVGDSKRLLPELLAQGEKFELVYVDGSHLGLDKLVDAALSWDMLTPGGVVVFDDYHWNYLGDDPLLRPGKAIDAFREVVTEKHEVVFAGEQIALRRIS